MSRSVGIVLLAAGASVRMGRPKQLLMFRGRTLLRRAAETALATTCRPVVVVLGAEADRAAREIEGLEVHPTINEHWPAGMGTSVAAGIRSLMQREPRVSAAVIVLCDQPLVTPALLEALTLSHRQDGRDRCACFYGGRLGVPALFARSWFPRLLELKDGGANRLLNESPGDVFAVPFPAGEMDVDTAEAYERLLKTVDADSPG